MYGNISNRNPDTNPFIIINGLTKETYGKNVHFPSIYPDLSGFFKVPGHLSIDISGFSDRPFPLICDDIFKCNSQNLPENVPNVLYIHNNTSDINPENGKIEITITESLLSPNIKPLKVLKQGEHIKMLYIPNKSYPKNWFIYS
jgi:hypothetical protein